MMKFEVHLLLDKWDEVEVRKNHEMAQVIWSTADCTDYMNYKLIDANKNHTILSGDTTHDNIYFLIRTFLEGVRYASSNTEDIEVTHWVVYTDGSKEQVED